MRFTMRSRSKSKVWSRLRSAMRFIVRSGVGLRFEVKFRVRSKVRFGVRSTMRFLVRSRVRSGVQVRSLSKIDVL